VVTRGIHAPRPGRFKTEPPRPPPNRYAEQALQPPALQFSLLFIDLGWQDIDVLFGQSGSLPR
jgi:hypothetical protein